MKSKIYWIRGHVGYTPNSKRHIYKGGPFKTDPEEKIVLHQEMIQKHDILCRKIVSMEAERQFQP
jgi:hypothetical protein